MVPELTQGEQGGESGDFLPKKNLIRPPPPTVPSAYCARAGRVGPDPVPARTRTVYIFFYFFFNFIYIIWKIHLNGQTAPKIHEILGGSP